MPEPGRSLVLVTPTAEIRSYPRLNKLVDLLHDAGWSVEHWPWVREDVAGDPDPRLAAVRVLQTGGGYARRSLALRYLLFSLRALRAVLAHGRGRRLYCLGFAAALPAAVASLLRPRRFLFDDNDNISLSYPGLGPLRGVLAALERFIAGRAALHLVPAASRWDRPDANLRVVPNVPSRAVLDRARTIVAERGLARDGVFTLYVNGLLTGARGAETLLATARAWDRSRPLRILVAGRPGCAAAEELLRLDLVETLGQLDHETALATYARADAVFTYYDPATRINRLAEPNKWGDGLALGVPFVANAEIETARPFVEAGICFTAPYADADALRRLLERLIDDPGALDDARSALGALDWRPWDEAMRDVLAEL